MNWEAIGAVGEIVGALGVILTLAYLAAQVRQNTEEMRSGQTQDLITANSEANYYMASDKELADIMQGGMLGPSELSDSDQFRFNVFWFAAYNRFDFAYHQYSRGRLDPELWEKMDYEIPLYLSLPGSRAWWERDKPRFSKKFVAYVEKRLLEFEAPQAIPTISIQPNRSAT
ncbi:MAG: hypothetical protein RIC85_00900 [Gammaproteobacteria bacterium]